MRLPFITLLLLICVSSFGQDNSYQNLLDTAINGRRPLFVHTMPLKVLILDSKEMRYYIENVKEYSNQILDSVILLQIIQNSKNSDTTLWTDKELPGALLVKKRDETVSKKYAFQKLEITDDKKLKFYKKQINRFNSTETIDRDLEYFSRPVFNNSKTFAVVQWDNGYSHLGGGGGIVLYRKQTDKTWREFGTVLIWKY